MDSNQSRQISNNENEKKSNFNKYLKYGLIVLAGLNLVVNLMLYIENKKENSISHLRYDNIKDKLSNIDFNTYKPSGTLGDSDYFEYDV